MPPKKKRSSANLHGQEKSTGFIDAPIDEKLAVSILKAIFAVVIETNQQPRLRQTVKAGTFAFLTLVKLHVRPTKAMWGKVLNTINKFDLREYIAGDDQKTPRLEELAGRNKRRKRSEEPSTSSSSVQADGADDDAQDDWLGDDTVDVWYDESASSINNQTTSFVSTTSNCPGLTEPNGEINEDEVWAMADLINFLHPDETGTTYVYKIRADETFYNAVSCLEYAKANQQLTEWELAQISICLEEFRVQKEIIATRSIRPSMIHSAMMWSPHCENWYRPVRERYYENVSFNTQSLTRSNQFPFSRIVSDNTVLE